MTKNEIERQTDNSTIAGSNHLGDFVSGSQSGTILQSEARALAEKHGLDEDLGFPKLSESSAYRRAVRLAAKVGKTDERRYEIVKVEDSHDRIVHSIIRKDIALNSLITGTSLSTNEAKYETETKVGFDKSKYKSGATPEDIIQIEDPNHPIASEVYKIYSSMCVHYMAKDIRVASQRAFRKWSGIRLIEHGNLYYVPNVYRDKVRAWKNWMKEMSNVAWVMPQFDSEETVEALQGMTQESVEDQLAELLEDLDSYVGKGTTRLSTLESRVDDFDTLRDQAELYERLLGHTLEDLKEKLNNAQKHLVESIKHATVG